MTRGQVEALWQSTPIGKPCEFQMEHAGRACKPIQGVVDSKKKHNDYTFTLKLFSLDRKSLQYLWMEVNPRSNALRVVGFKETVNE